MKTLLQDKFWMAASLLAAYVFDFTTDLKRINKLDSLLFLLV